MRPMTLAIILFASVGCTSHAGPFITSISPTGPGQIAVQKCMVEYSKFNNEISMSDCTMRTIHISTGDASPWAAPPKGWSTSPAPTPAAPPSSSAAPSGASGSAAPSVVSGSAAPSGASGGLVEGQGARSAIEGDASAKGNGPVAATVTHR